MVSENDFYLLNGNSYRGSRYANFSGAGTDPQGNVSQATNEAAANSSVGTHADASSQSKIGGTIQQVSPGLTAPPSPTKALTQAAIGTALPYAGQTIGAAAGNAINAGSGFGSAIGEGVSNLANKASGGLIGNSIGDSVASGLGSQLGSSTNSALSGLGKSFGPATSTEVSNAAGARIGGGASVGGSIGAGVGTLAADLISGQKVGKSLVDAGATGVGNYAGASLGFAVGGPVGAVIGGFLGGTIGHLFCFAPDTPILMADGTRKPVGDLRLGDEVMRGGMVTARGEAYTDELYHYKNTVVTGSHAVLDDGIWMRVEDSDHAEPVPGSQSIVCPVETSARILVTPWFISADISEIEGNTWDHTEEERIDLLNADITRNANLKALEKEVCVG